MTQTAAHPPRVSEPQRERDFLYTANFSLNQAIQRRLGLGSNDHYWQHDIPTSDVVVYRPNMHPLFIPGEIMRCVKRIKILGELNDGGEIYAGEKLIRTALETKKVFPSFSSWVELDYLQELLGPLGVEDELTRAYEQRLRLAKLDRVHVYALSQNWVNQQIGPFIRQLRLRGIKEVNFNRGGICADMHPSLCRAITL